MAKNVEHIQHIKSSAVIESNGVSVPKLPNPSALTEGEIAVNFAKGYETLSIKNSSGDVVSFSSDNYYNELKLGSGFTRENSANTVTQVIEDNELVWTNAYVAMSGTVSAHTVDTTIHTISVVSAVTVNANLTNVNCPTIITGSSKNGAQAIVVYENSGITTDYTISVSTAYKTPDGNQIQVTCPANGYCVIKYINVNGVIYARSA